MKLFRYTQGLTPLLLSLITFNLVPSLVSAIELDATQPDQLKTAAKNIAAELFSQYAHIKDGKTTILSGIPGQLVYPPYYWWESGAMFGTLIDYWYYTNDSEYNEHIRAGMIHQFGENLDLMPANQSKNEGNDDQIFWAFTMMSAAEYNFPKPPDDKPDWLAMTQSVFNQLVDRFEKEVRDKVCGGGLRWQIYPWLNGYDYKNMAANGGMFHLGARLAMYTKNDTYARWAQRAWDWMDGTPLLGDDGTVNDGVFIDGKECNRLDPKPWTYNYGIMIGGAAYMYAYTNGSKDWEDRINKYLNKSSFFFPENKGSVMVEICEEKAWCNVDQVSFKAYLSRWYAIAVQLAPFTRDIIMPRLRTSAQAAAKTCTGGSVHGIGVNGVTGDFSCGTKWWNNGYDGLGGVGQQMSALAVVSVNLVDLAPPPFTSETGGDNEGNPGLGSDGDKDLPIFQDPITTGDKVGASILTIIAVAATVGTGYWMMI